MTRYFTAPDGADEPTIWERADGDPVVVVRRAELPGPHADLLWSVLVGVLCADEETVDRLAQITCPYWPPDGLGCDPCRGKTRTVLAALQEGR
ncbi:MAG TPA: hypothetical protein VFR23_19425 [Jiangellaceae bacterium]|nr:hypothetical protein [Jiangellaceae bacterium]